MLEAGMSPAGRIRAWLAALAATAMVFAVFAGAAGAVPAGFWGVVPQGSPSPEQFQRLKQGGVGSVRVPIPWSLVEPVQGAPSWATIDPLVGGAATAGISVLPFLYGAPSWAVPVDKRWKSPENLPVRTGFQRAAWQTFLSEAVQRYGPQGTFWAENTTVPKRPLRTWQIWNEQNFKYFVARPNPAEYGKLLTLSASTIKAADPGAKLILGGMFARPNEATKNFKPPQAYFATDFLQQLYEKTPGIKSKFQGVALHPYTGNYKRLKPYIEEFREVLKVNHDAGKPLWITELGWSSDRPDAGDSFAKGPQGQVTQLKGAFSLLKANQTKWHLRGVYWFSIEDGLPQACNFCGGSGLFGTGFVPKPSWSAFVKFAGGRAG
jgi:polysaccharide biosynthesis protein PslG